MDKNESKIDGITIPAWVGQTILSFTLFILLVGAWNTWLVSRDNASKLKDTEQQFKNAQQQCDKYYAGVGTRISKLQQEFHENTERISTSRESILGQVGSLREDIAELQALLNIRRPNGWRH